MAKTDDMKSVEAATQKPRTGRKASTADLATALAQYMADARSLMSAGHMLDLVVSNEGQVYRDSVRSITSEGARILLSKASQIQRRIERATKSEPLMVP